MFNQRCIHQHLRVCRENHYDIVWVSILTIANYKKYTFSVIFAPPGIYRHRLVCQSNPSTEQQIMLNNHNCNLGWNQFLHEDIVTLTSSSCRFVVPAHCPEEECFAAIRITLCDWGKSLSFSLYIYRFHFSPVEKIDIANLRIQRGQLSKRLALAWSIFKLPWKRIKQNLINSTCASKTFEKY